MKKYTLLFLCLAVITSCNSGNEKTPASSAGNDAAFESFKNYYVDQLWKLNPEWATSVGYHNYDSILMIPSAEVIAATLKGYDELLDSCKKFREEELNAFNKTALWMMRDHILATKWYYDSFRGFEWNPATYNVGDAFATILNGNYDNLDSRLRSINLKLDKVSAYYDAARANIKSPSVEHTDLAILQNSGAVSIFLNSIIDSVKSSGLTGEEQKSMVDKATTAGGAVEGYVNWLTDLRKTLSPETAHSFRIGRELYFKKFEHDIQSGYTAEQVFEKAKKRKTELQSEMAGLSAKLWKKYFGEKIAPADTLEMIRAMIDRLSENHVHRDSFMSAIEKQMPELVKFISDKNLIYLDPSKPLVVRKTPGYMEGGGAGASINSPGPYDKNANTYYNVSPLSGYTEERAESYLREYNTYILQILNIHEAIPGHYTQLIYSNNSPDLIKSILGNGAMVEGWAVYGERMMMENGYGNSEPEMWLMYYKWHLRTVCNTILDYSVHIHDMSKEEAIRFLTKEAFQQQAEAENKWRRVTVSQVQLCSYFTGYSEIYDLREEVKIREGDKFSLKNFHEEFLSYGSAPVKYIRQLMVAGENEDSAKAN